MKLTGAVLTTIINEQSTAHNLSPAIVTCVILQESGADTAAFRFEQGMFDILQPKKKEQLSGFVPSLPNLISEKVQRSSSWGLMQVLGETARWCAKCEISYLSELCNPSIGIDIGCRVLAHYLARNGNDYTKALAAYNAGLATSLAGQKYATEVLTRLAHNEHRAFLQGK